jgi:hypothetical protein
MSADASLDGTLRVAEDVVDALGRHGISGR